MGRTFHVKVAEGVTDEQLKEIADSMRERKHREDDEFIITGADILSIERVD